MSDATTTDFRLGDRVRIRGYDALVGRIVELRGPLGPSGAPVYRVRFPRKPKAMHIEALAEQMERIAPVT